MGKVTKILLVLAVIVALFTRFWKINILPYPPDGDEVAFGYYGWSLLHFGTDEYGKILPTSFSSIGDYKYPALSYLNIIPAAIFGPNDMTTRFWNAIGGVVLVILVYLLSQFFFSNTKISLFSAWAVALSPWAIIVSRLGYETFLATVLVTAGFTSLLYYSKTKKTKQKLILLTLSGVLLFISMFTYAAARFFVPTFLAVFLALSSIKKGYLANHKKLLGIFFAVSCSIILITLVTPNNLGRAKEDIWKGITSEDNNRLAELYNQAGISEFRLPPRLTWLFNNKYRITLFHLIDKYTRNFSVSYLFTNGEAIGQKVPDMGVLLLVDIILIPLGLVALIKNKNKFAISIILLWLVIAPIPSTLTTIEAKMIRATLLIVPLSILSGLGFSYLTDLFKTKRLWISLLLMIAVFANFLFALNQIFIQKPLDKPWTNQEVGKDLALSILNLKDKYKAVTTGGNDYIYFLFYGKISPTEFIHNSDILVNVKWNRVARLYNIYFNMPYKCPKGGKLNVLYVCQGGDIPQNSKVIKTFYYPDGVPAYALIEFYETTKIPKNLPEPPKNFHYMVDVEQAYPNGLIPDNSPSLW
jgi:4-amino-4-deoxy-L-arabinose transferase-like glycosyltransferase